MDTPDAPHHPDAPNPADAPIGHDGPDVDAPPSGDQSRVWAVGDFGVDGQVVAGEFADGATLPFGPSSMPPLVVPGGTSVLASGTGYVRTFDATADGTKIAFVADLTTAGTFDLYVANGDGTSPTLLVAGQANVEIQAITLSPDGTKIAYTADSVALNGGYDLWVVNTAGTPAPVKVSPDRPVAAPTPANQDVFNVVTWSPDSKWLAFSGDLDTDTFDMAYVVDTTATTPTATVLLAKADIATQTTGAQGVRGALQFDVADRVYFRARVTAGSTQFQLFGIDPDGSNRTDLTALVAPARGDASTPDLGSFAMSPDGLSVAVSADAPTLGNYDIYYATLAAPTPVRLTMLAAAGHADFSSPIWFAPDGQHIAYVANFSSARREPYVSKIDGTDTHRLVSVLTTCNACTSPDADVLQWTQTGSAIYVQGDLTTNNDTKLYKLDPQMTDQNPLLAVDVPTGGDLSDSQVRRH